MSQAKLIGAQLGVAVFGPPGVLVGGIVGAVIDAALPWGDDVVKNVVANLLASGIGRIAGGWAKHEDEVTVNHDLQRAFRDAVCEALADIGGPTCFPKAWPMARRDVPSETVYLSSRLGQSSLPQRTALGDQVCQLLTTVARRIELNQTLALQPPADLQAANALTYLESATSQALADSLYDVTILPEQHQFGSLFLELPDLERHLRRHLLERTLTHMGELLKQRTEPWRAFNRWILEDLRFTLAQVKTENRDIAASLATLNQRIERLSHQEGTTPGLDSLSSTTANSIGGARLAAEDITLIVDTLIDEITRQQTQQIGVLRDFIAQQTGVIVTVISSTEARIIGQLAENQDELRQRLERIENSLARVLPTQMPEAQPLGQGVIAFRAAALRFHRTQSIPWRSAGGISLPLDRIYVAQELMPWDEGGNGYRWSEGESRSVARGQSPDATLLDQRTIVVLGEPGSGKTLLLHALGLQFASTCGLNSDGTLQFGFLPVFVSLAGFTQVTDNLGTDPTERLLGHIQRTLDARSPGMAAILDDLMAQGRVAFLFDALDEVSDRAEEHAVLAGIQALAAGAGARCLFVLTAREAAYGGSLVLEGPFSVYRLAALATPTQKAAIQNWLAVLSGLDERDEDLIESQTRRVVETLDRHPGMRQALRNPLLLRITLQVYLWATSAEGMPGLGKRFDIYVNRLLEGGGEPGVREPAWSDPLQARRYLGRLAWKMYEGAGDRSQAAAEQILRTECDLSESDARLFIRRVRENAGLLVLNNPNNKETRAELTTIAFGPHAMFGDFLVGSELARRWRQDRRACARLLRQKADDLMWQRPVLFCLSLLHADEVERKAAFGFVLDELSRDPLWGVHCLHEGLELTADELAASERRQVYQRLAAQADVVLNPNRFKVWLFQRQHRTESEFRTAANAQIVAMQALGKLQLCDAAEAVMQAVFSLSAEAKHVSVPLQGVLVDFGPSCLWPTMQRALLADEEWIRRSAAWIVSAWHQPEAIPALEWLLEREEFATAAVYGLASIYEDEVDATYRNLLIDPRYAEDALSAGLLALRPGLLEYALGELLAERLAEHHVKFLLEYAVHQSVTEAALVVREMLGITSDAWEITRVFEVDRSLQLPLLRLLVGLLCDPDPYLRQRAQDAISRVLKAGDLDPHFQDCQGILEQMLLYGDDWLPGEAVHQLNSIPLSQHTSEILWNRLSDPEAQSATLWLLQHAPRLPEEYRQRFIDWLKQDEVTASYDVAYLYCTRTYLGDRSVIPAIDYLLKQPFAAGAHDDPLRRALVRLRAVEAFPYVVALITEREDRRWEGAVALGMLAPVLSLQQRREAERCLRPLLESDAPWLRWVAICTMGELKVSTPQELLSQLQENVLEVQEPAIGLAIARLGTYDQLSPTLVAAIERRDATLCFTVLHTWSALGDPRCVNPLFAILGLPDNFLLSADHLLCSGDLVVALRYVKARAAVNLGRVVASLAGDTAARRSSAQGWSRLQLKLDDHSLAAVPGVASFLQKALAQPDPARVLKEQALAAQGRQRSALGWLVGAYEWSELLTQLSLSHCADSVPIWEMIDRMFDRTEAGEQEAVQRQLASGIGWTQELPPFAHLMQFAGQRDEILQEQVRYYFAREARQWYHWLKWRADVLVLPR